MNEWSTREWYPVLKRGQNLVLSDEWVLYQSGDTEVQMVHHSGAMSVARIEADGVCRVQVDPKLTPLPEAVVADLVTLLNLD
jgi:hypothetical protein